VKRTFFEMACSYFIWVLSWSCVVSYVKFVARVRFARRCIAKFSNMLSMRIQIQIYAILNGAPIPKEYKYALLSLSAMGIVLYMYSRPKKRMKSIAR
jgi:hypothetical protein